jgi:glutamate decarboxylase
MVHLNRIATTKEVNDAQDQFEQPKSSINLTADDEADDYSSTVYGSRYAAEDLPRHEMPDKEMPPSVAYRLIKDDLTLDGTPTLNLASFVTTYMEEEAEKLMVDAFSKNFIDYEEYPVSADIQNRCVSMIARLFNAPTGDDDNTIGTSTIGSSEAIMLGVLAMKKLWQNKRKAEGKPFDKPNMIMNSAVQVCWEKACRYFDVEERYVYCTAERYVIDPKECVDLCDENTIGICTFPLSLSLSLSLSLRIFLMGGWLTLSRRHSRHHIHRRVRGHQRYQRPPRRAQHRGRHPRRRRVWRLCRAVRQPRSAVGLPPPKGDFDQRVRVSCPTLSSTYAQLTLKSHKYGLVYPGVGWVVWRDPKYLPQELVFNINYLGADQASFTLNFSRGASQIIGQYYQLIRLGKRGYRRIMLNLTRTADYLSANLENLGFIIMSQKGGEGLPLVAARLDEDLGKHYDEFAV